MRTSQTLLLGLLLISALFCSACQRQAGKAGEQDRVIRVGYFPNITHAQALVASELTRQGKGWFEERIGDGVKVEWFVYNAGPSAMEAIFANSIDLTYVGPNPALNAYDKSQGEEIRVVAGAAEGGAALVVAGDGKITKPEDFRGRRIATPQLGGTQDVAARVWLKGHGYEITQLGGEVLVVPTPNPDQLALMQQGKLDGAWTVEPWVSRLELEAGGKIYLEQPEALTTILVAGVKSLKNRPELVAKFVAAHKELTQWINEHPEEAKALVQASFKELTKREMSQATVDRAWSRLRFTPDFSPAPFAALVKETQTAGLLKNIPPLDRLLAAPQ